MLDHVWDIHSLPDSSRFGESTHLLPRTDVQPLHHFGKRALVDHLPDQVGSHPFGVGEAPQQLPGHFEGGQRLPVTPRPRALPRGCFMLSCSPSIWDHVLQGGLHCCSWHVRQDSMRPPAPSLTLTTGSKHLKGSCRSHMLSKLWQTAMRQRESQKWKRNLKVRSKVELLSTLRYSGPSSSSLFDFVSIQTKACRAALLSHSGDSSLSSLTPCRLAG